MLHGCHKWSCSELVLGSYTKVGAAAAAAKLLRITYKEHSRKKSQDQPGDVLKFFFFNWFIFKLKANCFTELCWFLPNINMNLLKFCGFTSVKVRKSHNYHSWCNVLIPLASPIQWVSSVQLLSCVRLFATPWTAPGLASLSITNSWSLLELMPIESVMPSNHLIPCFPLLLLPSIFPNIRVFSNDSVLHIRWPKYWSFSFNISPS